MMSKENAIENMSFGELAKGAQSATEELLRRMLIVVEDTDPFVQDLQQAIETFRYAQDANKGYQHN